MNRNKTLAAIVLHAFLVVTTIVVTTMGVLHGAGKGQLGENMINWGYFKAFTVDSNVLNGICSLITIIVMIKNLFRKSYELPYGLVVLQLVAAAAVGLTFLVVLTFLAPIQVMNGHSYFTSFMGTMFFFHFLNPILGGVMACHFTGNARLGLKQMLLAMIPFVIYAIVYVYEVVFVKQWMDFYGFTFGGKNYMVPIMVTIIALAQFGITAALRFAHNRIAKKNK